jgi:hypothetical protein
MTPKKATYILIALLTILIVAGVAAFYYGDKILQARSAEISEEKIQLEAVNTELSLFKNSKDMVDKYGFVKELSGKILPESKFQSEVLAELTKFAADNNMKIQTLTFGTDNSKTDDPNLSQTSTIKGLSGVRVLNASIQFSNDPAISYESFINFLKNVESNQRKMQVSTLSITPDPENSAAIASATVTVNIFLKEPSSNQENKGQ